MIRKILASNFTKLCCIVCLAFILSQTAIIGFYSMGVIEAKFDSSNFEYSDAYNRILYTPKRVSDYVVLVSTDPCSRQEIAATVDSLEKASPNAVGVDILFSNSECDFDTSISHLIRYDNVVFAAMSGETDFSICLEKSFFCEHVDNDNIGVVKSDVENLTDVVRTFTFSYTFDSILYQTFPVAVANIAHPDLCEQFISESKNNQLDDKAIINFQDVSFVEIPAGQILNPHSDLDWKNTVKNKVVLVGNLHDTQDMFITPIDRHMNGTRIYAYAIETILGGRHIKLVAKVVDWIIAMAFCLSMLLLNSFVKKKLPDTGSLVMRLVQIVSLIMFLFFGCLCFRYGDVYIDCVPAMLMLALSVFASDIWNGVAALLKKIKKQRS